MTLDTLIEKAKNDFSPKNVRKWVGSLPKIEPKKEMLIEKSKLDSFTIDEFLGWINTGEYIDRTNAEIELKNFLTPKKGVPTKYKKGDVLMHPIFRHPYVLLEYNTENGWLCGLLTSEKDCVEILEEAKSRFFGGNYFTKVLFTVKNPIGSYMYPFDNGRQLTKVLKELRNILV